MADNAVLKPGQCSRTPISSARDQVPVLGYRNYWYPATGAGPYGLYRLGRADRRNIVAPFPVGCGFAEPRFRAD